MNGYESVARLRPCIHPERKTGGSGNGSGTLQLYGTVSEQVQL